MTVEETAEKLQAHYPCAQCADAHGISTMCLAGARVYAEHLGALAVSLGRDPNELQSYRWARERGLVGAMI